MDLSDRDLRQREIIPPKKLAGCRATVIGLGSIGRQVALQLAAMGIPWLQLIDHDIVEEVNLATQGYTEWDLGHPKVKATGFHCWLINSKTEIVRVQERFRRSGEVGNVIFCCVDSIETRRLIWDSVKDRVGFFADGRMAGEVLRVLTATDPNSFQHYPTTLFPQEETYAGSCTSRSTIFCANIAAGLMLSQFSRWLRGLPVAEDLCLNLLADELVVTSAAS